MNALSGRYVNGHLLDFLLHEHEREILWMPSVGGGRKVGGNVGGNERYCLLCSRRK